MDESRKERMYVVIDEMLNQRGYFKDEESKDHEYIVYNHDSRHEKENYIIQNTTHVFKKRGSILVCKDIQEKPTKTAVMEKLVNIYIKYNKKHTHVIMPYQSIMKCQLSSIQASVPSFMTLELLNENKHRFNITKHKLVPEHHVLYKEDAEKIYSKYGMSLPVISLDDPVARFYNMSPFYKDENGNNTNMPTLVLIKRKDASTYRMVQSLA